MKDTDKLGKDKLQHFLVCFFAALIHPMLAIGLALGKEEGDKRAKGNHWCWWDIMWDTLGIIIGSTIRYLLMLI